MASGLEKVFSAWAVFLAATLEQALEVRERESQRKRDCQKKTDSEKDRLRDPVRETD